MKVFYLFISLSVLVSRIFFFFFMFVFLPLPTTAAIRRTQAINAPRNIYMERTS